MSLKDLLPYSSKDKNIVTILDIGSSKITCIIADLADGKKSILGYGCHSAGGFKNGNITDFRLAKSSIVIAVEKAEKLAEMNIENIVLVLNGNKISSHYLNVSTNLRKKKVFEQDINDLLLKAVNSLEKKGLEVIHYAALEFIVDGNAGIKEPRGLLGHKLSAIFHFVTAPTALLTNVVSCLASCQLNVNDCVFAPYVAGLSTLTKNEMEYGATVIDFGSDITSYALFAHNDLVNCGFIPIGSSAITNDIAKSFGLDFAVAERLKVVYGAATITYVDCHKIIDMSSDQQSIGKSSEEDAISNAELNHVINARVDEILQLLKTVLNKQYPRCPNAEHSVVITGGGSLLVGIAEQAASVFLGQVRIGKPSASSVIVNQEIVNAQYASAIGVLNIFSDNRSLDKILPVKSNMLKTLLNWLKDNF